MPALFPCDWDRAAECAFPPLEPAIPLRSKAGRGISFAASDFEACSGALLPLFYSTSSGLYQTAPSAISPYAPMATLWSGEVGRFVWDGESGSANRTPHYLDLAASFSRLCPLVAGWQRATLPGGKDSPVHLEAELNAWFAYAVFAMERESDPSPANETIFAQGLADSDLLATAISSTPQAALAYTVIAEMDDPALLQFVDHFLFLRAQIVASAAYTHLKRGFIQQGVVDPSQLDCRLSSPSTAGLIKKARSLATNDPEVPISNPFLASFFATHWISAAEWLPEIETCDDIDNDCNGKVDDGAGEKMVYYRDEDSDGFGAPETTLKACSPPSGYVSQAGDCRDARPDIHPGAEEICDTEDNDCDGSADVTDTCVCPGGMTEFVLLLCEAFAPSLFGLKPREEDELVPSAALCTAFFTSFPVGGETPHLTPDECEALTSHPVADICIDRPALCPNDDEEIPLDLCEEAMEEIKSSFLTESCADKKGTQALLTRTKP